MESYYDKIKKQNQKNNTNDIYNQIKNNAVSFQNNNTSIYNQIKSNYKSYLTPNKNEMSTLAELPTASTNTNTNTNSLKAIYDSAQKKQNEAEQNFKSYLEKNGVIAGEDLYRAPNSFTIQKKYVGKELPVAGSKEGTQSYNKLAVQEENNVKKYDELMKSEEAKQLYDTMYNAKTDATKAKSEYEISKAKSDYENASDLGKTAIELTAPLRGAASAIFRNDNIIKNKNGDLQSLPNYLESLNTKISSDANLLGKIVNDVGVQAGKLGVSAAENAILPGLGTTLYSTNMYLDNYDSAIREGYNNKQATAYAAISTGLEYATQRLLGAGVARFKGDSPFESWISEKIRPVISSETVNKLLSSMASEGSEEFVQEYLDQINRNLTLGEEKQIFTGERLSQAVYSGIIGALSSGVTQGSGIIMRNNIQSNYEKLVYDIERETNTNLNEEEKAFIYNNIFEQALENNGSINTESIKENFNSAEGKTQIANDIEESIKVLENTKKETESKKQQKKIDNQIKSLQEQLTTIQEQIKNVETNTQNQYKQTYSNTNLENNILPYSQKEIENYKNGKVQIATSENIINSFIENAKKMSSNAKLYFGKISENLSNKIKQAINVDLKNYNISLKADNIRHILKKHGSQAEILRGQIPVTVEDFKLIPQIVSNYDSVENNATTQDGKPAITFAKQIGNKYYLVNYVSDKSHNLEVQTMWKQKKNPATADNTINSPTQTSKTNSSTGSSTKDNTTNQQKSQKKVLPSKRVQNELNELEGLKAADKVFELNEEEAKKLDTLSKKYDKEYITKKKQKVAEKKALTEATKEAKENLGLTSKESREFKEKLKKLTNNTKEELMNDLAKKDVKKIISDYAERIIKHNNENIHDIKNIIRNRKIKVSEYLKKQITDYNDFKKRNFGKLKLSNEGTPVDSFYEELKIEYPSYFDSDIVNDVDILETLADFMDNDSTLTEVIKLTDEEINDIADKVYKKLLDNSLTLDEIDNISKEIYDRINKKTRKDVQEQLLDEMGITTDDLQVGKDISSIDFQRTDPIRVNEKVFGYKTGNKINDATIKQTKHNEAERTRFLNKERAEIKDLGIKAHSKESAAVQKYGEKQYITDKGTIVPYGDTQLMSEFPDANTQNKIKNAAKEIRKKYDAYIDQINSVITEMGYDPIPKRQDYFRHFQEIGDKLSEWGIPLNADSLSKDTLPTDINGVTDQFKPGKNWFASALQRKGMKTTYDAITGIDGYLEGASNLIYHTEDIQRYRALSKLVRDTYGQTHGLDNIDLNTKDGQQRLNDIFDNKLSKYAAWLDEQANALAGKKGGIDRAAERVLGRKIYTVLDTAKKQVGSNMTGYNVRSALTNFASTVQGASKTKKSAWIKGTISTMQNIIHDDGLINKSDFLTSRFGSDQLSKKLWQKASNAGQIFMTGTDYFTANQIWRSKYFENLSKGMNENQAIKNADDFAARIMGDRSKGSTAEVFNSKTLGLLTQFQLEVNNQWSSIIHDNKMDIKSGNKSGATVMFQLGQLAAMSYLFNNFMRALTGSDVMIDPIDLLKKIIGSDDDDEDKTLEEKAREAFGELLEDVPFVSIMNGGRIPMSEAFKGAETLLKYSTGQKDKYGNDIKLDDVKKDLIESGYYWLLPTGYGQLKKTTKGLSMYSKNLPVSGSYTDSGNLRFTADESTAGKVKAALFGQYASKEAQKYVDSGYKTVTQSHIKEMQDLGMSSSEYIELRSDLNAAKKTKVETENGTYEMYTDNNDNWYWYNTDTKQLYSTDLSIFDSDSLEKSYKDVSKLTKATQSENVYKYIMGSSFSNKEKAMLLNNELNRKNQYTTQDIKANYNSLDEMDYAKNNSAKYKVITQIASYDKYQQYKDKIKDIKANTKNDKVETISYINSLPLSIPQKAMFIKQYYKSFTQYDGKIINYINNQPLSINDKKEILTNLGYKIRNGKVYSK